MSKFFDKILENVTYGVRYKYAPETFFVRYNDGHINEDITEFIGDKSLTGQKFLRGDIKEVEDDIKRGFRKYSKFSNRHKPLTFSVILSDNHTILQSRGYRFTNRFEDINVRLNMFKQIKEHISTKTFETAALNGKCEVESVLSKLEYEGLTIKSVKFF